MPLEIAYPSISVLIAEMQALVINNITTNGNEEITGAVHRTTLLGIIDRLDQALSQPDAYLITQFPAWNEATTYTGGEQIIVGHNGSLWVFMSDDDNIGTMPGTDATVWFPASALSLAHRRNKDLWLNKGGDNAVSAAEIRQFIDNYTDTGGNITTDDVSEEEGATNRWFTAARVLATLLSGLQAGLAEPILETDTLLEALAKLQAQIDELDAAQPSLQSAYDNGKTIETDGQYANQAGVKIKYGSETGAQEIEVTPTTIFSRNSSSGLIIKVENSNTLTFLTALGTFQFNSYYGVITTNHDYKNTRTGGALYLTSPDGTQANVKISINNAGQLCLNDIPISSTNTITDLITEGTGVIITGSGTAEDPYVITADPAAHTHEIEDVTGLQNSLDSLDFYKVEKEIGKGIVDNAHYREPVADTTALAAVEDYVDKERRYVASESCDYFYDAAASAGDIAPADQAGGVGYWIKNSADISGLTTDQVQPTVLNKYHTDANALDSDAMNHTGTEFPAAPYNGMYFYRTDLGELFIADTVRGKWLGELRQDQSGSANAASTGNLGRINGTAGIPIEYNMCIVGASAQVLSAYTGDFQIKDGSSSIGTLAFSAETSKSDYALNLTIPAGGRLVTAVSAATDKPIFNVYFKRYFTI